MADGSDEWFANIHVIRTVNVPNVTVRARSRPHQPRHPPDARRAGVHRVLVPGRRRRLQLLPGRAPLRDQGRAGAQREDVLSAVLRDVGEAGHPRGQGADAGRHLRTGRVQLQRACGARRADAGAACRAGAWLTRGRLQIEYNIDPCPAGTPPDSCTNTLDATFKAPRDMDVVFTVGHVHIGGVSARAAGKPQPGSDRRPARRSTSPRT